MALDSNTKRYVTNYFADLIKVKPNRIYFIHQSEYDGNIFVKEVVKGLEDWHHSASIGDYQYLCKISTNSKAPTDVAKWINESI